MARRAASRVSKRSGSKTTRSRSKKSASASGIGSASGAVLERMVEEAARPAPGELGDDADVMDVDVDSQSDGGVRLQEDMGVEYEGKGKGKLAALPAEEEEEQDGWIEGQPFRLFDLPTEIRLEIYRACLTRPTHILLSKAEKPAVPEAEEEVDEDGNGGTQAATGSRNASSQHSSGPIAARRRAANRGSSMVTLRASSSTNGSQSSLPPMVNTLPNTSRPVFAVAGDSLSQRRGKKQRPTSTPTRDPADSPLIVNLLRTTKAVYKEARDVLYGENTFRLDVFTAVASLAALHQRSRRRIKHVELEIPTYTEILESFSETVRLSLRYCFGLRKLVVHTPFTLPGSDGQGGGGNTTVYANGFDILRWLPQSCEVVVEGKRNAEIDAVVGRHMLLAGRQDKLAYARRQLISNDADGTT